MKKLSPKIFIFFSIIIAIFVIGIVPKEFQNDTFFNISIGKYILENGIDMQEHWAFTPNLSYTFSHWAFDVAIYLVYNAFNFTGIYIFTIIVSILTYIALFYCLSKRSGKPVISLLLILFFSYFIRDCLAARSQIISFICFIIEIYCIEQFIDTNKKKYGIILLFLSVIIANFHAATWPLFLVLFMPYLAAAFFNYFNSKFLYRKLIKRDKNKLKNLSNNSPKYAYYKEDLDIYTRLLKNAESKINPKIVSNKSYRATSLIILMIIIAFSGLVTPIHDTPYSYILDSMFGYSNFGNEKSIAYVEEMKPIVLSRHIELACFILFFIVLLAIPITKIKLEHIFLLSGLLIMTISSVRYLYLFIMLGTYVLCDLLSQCSDKYLQREMPFLEKIIVHPISILICVVIVSTFTIQNLKKYKNVEFIEKYLYPIEAVNYIKENLDYKNMRIFNSYNFGSYLMFNDIPVFIDSRLDVYCSEFNDTDIFFDYVKVFSGDIHYNDIFKKYNFTHILLYNSETINTYIKNDSNYNLIYVDEYFSLYEYIN